MLQILNSIKKVIKLLLSSPIYDGLLRLSRRSDAITYASKAKLSMVSQRPSNMFMPIVLRKAYLTTFLLLCLCITLRNTSNPV